MSILEISIVIYSDVLNIRIRGASAAAHKLSSAFEKLLREKCEGGCMKNIYIYNKEKYVNIQNKFKKTEK